MHDPTQRPTGRRLAGLAACALAASQAGFAEDDVYPTRETLPEGVVLVAKLVTAREVQPTTGVVVGNGGQVLVPASFVTDDDEIVVLEGGGSIALNGRRTRVARRSSDDGLVVLDVDGLTAAPLTLGFPPGGDGDELRFGAFPPARQLAAGRGPMWLPATLSANETAGIYGVAETPRLPNVTGPLFNACEQWVGYSLAAGEPGLASDLPPVVMFGADLKRALDRMGVEVREARCDRPPPYAGEATTPSAAASMTGPTVEPVTGGAGTEQETEVSPAPVATEPVGDARAPSSQPSASASQPESAEPRPYESRHEPTVQPMLTDPRVLAGAAFLVLLVLVLFGFARRRRQSGDGEPDTVVLLDGGRSATPADGGRLPPGTDAWLRVHADDAAGHSLDARFAVDADDFACVLGRRDADLVIDHPSVSRSHLRVEARDGRMTLGDLGSTNGTSVAGARCLPGEIVYIDAGEKVGVGELALRLTLEREADAAT